MSVPSSAPPASVPRILVVDDSAIIRALLRRTLGLHSYEVEEAADGMEALERLRSDPRFDLIIVDLAMPRMDGASFIRRVRDEPTLPRYPILVLSAEDLEPGVNPLGADAFMVKPFRPSELLIEVGQLLQQV